MRLMLAMASLAVVFSVGCGQAQQPLSAAFCAVAHTDGATDERTLDQLIGEFASTHGLQRRDSLPAAVDYISENVDLGVTFRVGRFGSEVSLFYRQHDGDALRDQLATYLQDRVNPQFRVTLCRDIPGYGLPQLAGEKG